MIDAAEPGKEKYIETLHACYNLLEEPGQKALRKQVYLMIDAFNTGDITVNKKQAGRAYRQMNCYIPPAL